MIRELVLAEGSVSRIAPTLLTVDAELLEAFEIIVDGQSC